MPVPQRAAQTAGGRFIRPGEKKTGTDVAQRTDTGNYTSPAFSIEDAAQIDGLLTVTAATSTPSIALKLQGSTDGTNWYDCPPGATPAQTAAGSYAQSWVALGIQGRWVATVSGSVSWNLDTQARLY